MCVRAASGRRGSATRAEALVSVGFICGWIRTSEREQKKLGRIVEDCDVRVVERGSEDEKICCIQDDVFVAVI